MPIANVSPLHIVGGSVTFSMWQHCFMVMDVDYPPIQLVAARLKEEVIEDDF